MHEPKLQLESGGGWGGSFSALATVEDGQIDFPHPNMLHVPAVLQLFVSSVH
jgi:hypothetical protein